MEKTVKWEGPEVLMMQQIEQEKTQILAQIGSLMMDLELAKKALENVNERYKASIKQALTTRNIGAFDSARPFPGGVILNMSDQPSAPNGGI